MKKINHLGEINRVPLELKSTINLPKTDFPMKANLPQNEPKALARWEEMGIYERIREARQGAPTYVLHDGPPYANGPIHLGHALNKCLKDFIVKSKTMSGFDSPYVPGWDCHGLPIEIKVDQQLGGKKLADGQPGGPGGVQKVRAKISRSAARAVQAHRRLRALGRPLLHHDSAVRVGGAGDVLRFSGKRIRL